MYDKTHYNKKNKTKKKQKIHFPEWSYIDFQPNWIYTNEVIQVGPLDGFKE